MTCRVRSTPRVHTAAAQALTLRARPPAAVAFQPQCDACQALNCTSIVATSTASMRSHGRSPAPGDRRAAEHRRSRLVRASAATRVTTQGRRRLAQLAAVQLRKSVAQRLVEPVENVAEGVDVTKDSVYAHVAEERPQERARRGVCCRTRCGADRRVCFLAVGLNHWKGVEDAQARRSATQAAAESKCARPTCLGRAGLRSGARSV